MCNIEFVQGKETHSSYWGKFYVKGLEEYHVLEEFDIPKPNNHCSYSGYCAYDLPENTIFTIFEQNGNKKGTDKFAFAICITSPDYFEWKADYGAGFIRGNFRTICWVDSRIKAPRLMNWWQKGDNSLAYAERCAMYIEKRGVKDLPPIDHT